MHPNIYICFLFVAFCATFPCTIIVLIVVVFSYVYIGKMPKRHRQPASPNTFSKSEGHQDADVTASNGNKLGEKESRTEPVGQPSLRRKQDTGIHSPLLSFIKNTEGKHKEKKEAVGKTKKEGLSAPGSSTPSSLFNSSEEDDALSSDAAWKRGDGSEEDQTSTDNSSVNDIGEDKEKSFDSYDVSDYDDDDSDDSEMEGEEDHSEQDEDEEEPLKGGNITVSFEVYDMEKRHRNAVVHLIDQFCPDSRNEVDRSSFAEALLESPYTSIAKMNEGAAEEESDGNSGAEDEEEEELCGMCSVIHFFHCLSRHPNSFKPLEKILSENVWKTLYPGIHPLDLLRSRKQEPSVSTKDSSAEVALDRGGAANMKALLWIFEHIQTVPMELTTQVMIDTLSRLESDSKKLNKKSTPFSKDSIVKVEAPLCFPCLFVVLAKVQRALSAEPTSPPASAKSKKENKKNNSTPNPLSSEGNAEGKDFLLKDYIFWREEDELLFSFRDKRVAVLVYRCRPQYDGQPEMDIPLSLMFAVQNGAAHQVAEELKKRAVAPSEVTCFR